MDKSCCFIISHLLQKSALGGSFRSQNNFALIYTVGIKLLTQDDVIINFFTKLYIRLAVMY